MKSIPLTRRLFALVDDEDYEEVRRHKWHINDSGVLYAARREKVDGKVKALLLHREIMKPPPGMEIDHLDDNGLNNTRANLRICTHAQNIRRRRISKNSTTGYRGIRRRESGNYQAIIKLNGNRTYLGTYRSKLEAAQAYDRAAAIYFGRDARLNCA